MGPDRLLSALEEWIPRVAPEADRRLTGTRIPRGAEFDFYMNGQRELRVRMTDPSVRESAWENEGGR